MLPVVKFSTQVSLLEVIDDIAVIQTTMERLGLA